MSATDAPLGIFRTLSATSGSSSSSRSRSFQPVGALIAHHRREAAAADRVDARLPAPRRPTASSERDAATLRRQRDAFACRVEYQLMTETTLTPSRLWKRMTLDQRQRAARAFWADPEATDDQVQAALLIAQQKKFRPKTVIGLDRRSQGEAPGHGCRRPRPDRGARAGHLPPRRAAPDDGRVSRRARHRARERADSGRERQA